MKKTAVAPSNIAFIKYWGRKNEALRLPENGSISMNTSQLLTTTTVEFSSQFSSDSVTIDGQVQAEETKRVVNHLDRIRNLANIHEFARIVSKNSFPSKTGLSSSASGFAALSLAGSLAAGLSLNEKELSILARQGSGSACRSVPSGFVEWVDGDTSEESFAYSLYPENYWKLRDVVAVVSSEAKEISTSEGQSRVNTSLFFNIRKKNINKKINEIKDALSKKDFEKLGTISEQEALEMHAIMLTSWPPLIYWTEGTLKLIKLVETWRKSGIPVYFTLNTGQDIHLLCEEQTLDVIQGKLKDLPFVRETITNIPSQGVKSVEQHLF